MLIIFICQTEYFMKTQNSGRWFLCVWKVLGPKFPSDYRLHNGSSPQGYITSAWTQRSSSSTWGQTPEILKQHRTSMVHVLGRIFKTQVAELVQLNFYSSIFAKNKQMNESLCRWSDETCHWNISRNKATQVEKPVVVAGKFAFGKKKNTKTKHTLVFALRSAIMTNSILCNHTSNSIPVMTR